ncbi:hypothetical protein KI387_004428, partial [Taxus chinensis]
MCQLMDENEYLEVPEEKVDHVDGEQHKLRKADSLPMVLFFATNDECYSDIEFFLTY